MMTLKKQCIKTILDGSLNYDQLPRVLKYEIAFAKDCCFTLSMKGAFLNGHYGCFVEAYDTYGLDSEACKSPFTPATDEVHLEMLKYILEHNEPLLKEYAYSAASTGHLKTLRYLKDCGLTFNMRTIAFASGGGNLPCLEFCHTNYLNDGEPETEYFKDSVCEYAVLSGSLDCVKFAYNAGYPFENAAFYSLQLDNFECYQWILTQEYNQWWQY